MQREAMAGKIYGSKLEIRSITALHRLPLARLMERLKPEWWDYQEAMELLANCHAWLLETEHGQPVGWLAARLLIPYRTVEIESMGFDGLGELKVNAELLPLIETCEMWARKQGMANLRYVMGSGGMTCHDRAIEDPGTELALLRSQNRPDFDWFLSIGFRPWGILPEIYGYHYHGILLIKALGV
jgi:hypothetical protein